MGLTYGLSTVCDLFAKLQRDAALLEEEVTSDRLFNFVVTGWSLVDWIKNDPSVPACAKERSLIKGLRADRWVQICGDLATASKHFSFDRAGTDYRIHIIATRIWLWPPWERGLWCWRSEHSD